MDLPPGYYQLQFSGYLPFMQADGEFAERYGSVRGITDMSRERLWSVYLMAKQSLHVVGDFFECGVYAGGSALFIAKIMEGSGKTLHLFDTFTGMPETDPEIDNHRAFDFSDVPIETVRASVGHEDMVEFHPGLIPETFAGLEDVPIAFAHLDVDIYSSMLACCEFVYPRLSRGGIMVIDDYGQWTCQGVRKAVDEYFADKDSVPLSMMNNSAVVFKL